MAKRLRIAILYNEPTSTRGEDRQFVTTGGHLDGSGVVRNNGGRGGAQPQMVDKPLGLDLSEVGVLEEMEDIKSALTSLGYRPSIFNVDSDIYRLLDYLRNEKPDLIFNLVECVENESLQEMHVAGLYELLKIPYTGAGAYALGTALNKPRVKELLLHHGIPTAAFQVFAGSSRIALSEDLQFPVIIKPSREDGSVGISDASVVTSNSELRKRVQYILEEFQQPALVEEFIDGRELNVAILGYREPILLPISEIDFSGLTDGMQRIVSYEAKWLHGTVAYQGTKGVCPASLTSAQEAKMRAIALKCFRLIGCRDYCRVDFRMKKDGSLYVLEVNPNPDISDDAGFARSAKAYGLTFVEIVGRIVESALDRARHTP